MKAQKAGKYRQRVALYDVPELTQDSYGQPSTVGGQINSTASDQAFAAEVRPLKGQEQLNVRQMWPTATHTVKMRWIGSAIPSSANNPFGLILPRMYLVDLLQNSQLNILFAENVEMRNRQWVLTCEEKVIV